MGIVCLLVSCAAVDTAFSQSINWRKSFNDARREAKEKNLPILMDFGTPSCYWCTVLDKKTFQDPQVVKAVNDNFVAVKIDGEKYPSLVKSLSVKSYPALIFAASDGTVVDYKEGYVPPDLFMRRVQTVLAQIKPTGPATDVITQNDTPSEVKLTSLTKVSETNVSRETMARQLLEQARMEFSTRQLACCFLRCKLLVATFPDLPEGKEASQLLVQLKQDPGKVAETAAKFQASLGELYLEMAQQQLRVGQTQTASGYLTWVTQACQGTPQAAVATQLLQQISQRNAISPRTQK